LNSEEALPTHGSFNGQGIRNIQKVITPNVCEIHAYRLARREQDVQIHSLICRNEPSVVRNGLCTCGSGKKYKKCCLHLI
jgi:uncharacterized protein YecA (UPF0149 family)